jgi:N-methylhydantoinase A
MTYNIAVDIGGTFTDCVVHEVAGDRIVTAKAPSQRADLGGGVLNSVRTACERLGVDLATVLGSTERFIHGSTVATNAMIERDGVRTAYLTTLGHEDTLAIGKVFRKRAGLSEREISHMNRLGMADPPLIERELVFGVNERVDYRGRVVVALTDEEIAAVVARVRDCGADAVAICLLRSFLTPAHERRLADALAAALPGVYVSDVARYHRRHQRRRQPYRRPCGLVTAAVHGDALRILNILCDQRHRRREVRVRVTPSGRP